MPREHLSMRKIKEVLRLRHQQGLSYAQISTACQIGVGSVHSYLHRAHEAGLSWPLPVELDDHELEERLFGPAQPNPAHAALEVSYLSRELRRKGVTRLLLWEEYRQAHPDGYSYSRFCELYREQTKNLEPRLHQFHQAGEKLFVDYAGQTMPITDRQTGLVQDAAVFVATLGASNYTFAEVTLTQSLPDWIGSHQRAFAFFGGVPAIVVPDNLKSGVSAVCRYEPDLNPTYQEMAEHYGVAVLPARVRKPRDKAKVENHVRSVEQRLLAPLRNRTFFSLCECNQALAERLIAFNGQPFQQRPGSRQQLFAELDAPALRPLPLEPYQFGTWKEARVNIDYHVAVEQCFYSVPYTLLRQKVNVRLSQGVVEIFHQGRRVASHLRCLRPHQHITVAAHMPQAHREYLDWTPERLIHWAQQSGNATAQLVENIMATRLHPQQGFRSCLGVMRLGQQYGAERLEAACRRALDCNACRYKSVRSILQHGLDQIAVPNADHVASLPPLHEHANLRGPDYYRRDPQSNQRSEPQAHKPTKTDKEKTRC